YCKDCLSKQQKINELEEENVRLKARLRYQERTAKEGYFGSSTPSSKIPVKANITSGQAGHPAIRRIQDIFREKADRLYHWADDRAIPADNNLAERELRPLVIARKLSFGSQSDAGARTRETLMTVLNTLKKKTPDVTAAFKSALDKLAEQPDSDPFKLLFDLDFS
ncbi:MAG TPA: transposase, partial [Sedimentisphaerales bacterium]|nr:transposase [Sedimentisphaerales bacterium]